MKKIFVGLSIGLLLLTSGVSIATQKDESQTHTSSLDDNVPIWQVGNSWTYTMNNITVNYNNNGNDIIINGRIDDFIWTVTDTSDSTYYTVNFTGKLTATYDIAYSNIGVTKEISGTLKPLFKNLKGTILFTKSNLQIHDATAEIKGFTKATIAPLTFSLPFLLKVTADSQLSKDFPLFDFPLSSNKYWYLSNFDATINVNAGGIFKLIQIPVIAITIHHSWMPWLFNCQEKQDITVPAGTFSAYKISSTFSNSLVYYYAPEVGNLVKIDATLQNGECHGELTSMNYP